jgi:hypothetical protein
MTETPGQYNTQRYEFFPALREQRHASLLSCMSVFESELGESGYGLDDFILALSTHLKRNGYPEETIKLAEDLAQKIAKVGRSTIV